MARENVILAVFNQLQEREKAIIKDSMEEAQMRLLESTLEAEKKKKNKKTTPLFSLKKLCPQLHTYFNESVSFNDNVDSQHDNKKSSIINTLTPGIKMNLQDKRKSIALDSYINNVFYNNRRRSNGQNVELDILANFNIKRYVLGISNNYYSNYFASEKFGVDDDDISNYWRDSFNLVLARNFNRIGFDLGYGRAYSIYEPLYKSSDSITDAVSFNQYLRLASKTRLLFAYNYGRTKHQHTLSPDDSQSNSFTLSLTGVLSPKITASGEMGYVLERNKLSDNSRSTTFTGKLGHRISKYSNLSFGLIHNIYEQSTKSNYYTQNSFQLSGNHRLAFNPKLKFSFNSEAAYTHYPKKTDYEQINESYTLGLGLSYAFRQWLDFNLAWTYTKSESNVNIDYDANAFTFSTQAKF